MNSKLALNEEELKATQKLSKDEQDLLFDIVQRLKDEDHIYPENDEEEDYRVFGNTGAEEIYNALKQLILANRLQK